MATEELQGAQAVQTASETTSKAVTFTIDFDDMARKPSRPPKMIARRQRQAKPQLTEATLEEKLRLADERRQQFIDERLERIHQRELEALAIARAMDPMVQLSIGQNKSAASREIKNDAIKAAKAVVSMNNKVQKDFECSQ